MQRSKGKSIAVKMATEIIELKRVSELNEAQWKNFVKLNNENLLALAKLRGVVNRAHKQLELGEYESAKKTMKEVIGE